MFLLFVLFLLILLLIIILLQHRFTYWSRKGVDTVSPTLFFGNAATIMLQNECFATNIKTIYDNVKDRGKKFVGYYFLWQPMLMPIDLDFIKTLLTNEFNSFTDHTTYENRSHDPLSAHLLFLQGNRWRKMRTKLSPTFTSQKMKMMFDTILACTSDLTNTMEEKVKQKQMIDVKKVAGIYATDVIVSCGFGIDSSLFNSRNSEFHKHQNKILGSSFTESLFLLFSFLLPDFFSLLKIRMYSKGVSDFFINLVSQIVKHREENNIIRKDFMHLLLQVRNNVDIKDDEVGKFKNEECKEKVFSLEEMAAQCFLFIFAGFETSATTISYALMELALNQDIQDKVREEINSILKKHNGEFTYKSIVEMEYMSKCLFETLRKYPPVPINTRVCTNSYKIPNSTVVIEKGTQILIPTYAIQMDPEYYPDPERFDPERFSNEYTEKRRSTAFMPFGAGPRMCIGYQFGILKIKICLATLLTRYKFFPLPGMKTPVKYQSSSLLLNPAVPIKLIAEKVSN